MTRIASRISQLNGEGALAVYSRAKELERQGRSIIHLELGEPDFHPAAPVVDALRDAVAAGRDRYCSTRGVPALREAIAEYLKRTRNVHTTTEQVLVTPGCKMALSLAMMALIAVLEELAALAAKHDLWVLADEIYARILFSGEYKSISSLPGMAARTVIIDGFSKSFAMTGWRLGYAVAPVEVIDAMDLLVLNTFTCAAEFTQVAAIEALRDSTNAVDAMVSEYRKRRDQFVVGLNQIPGFRCQATDGAFYAWVNIEDTGLSAEELQKLLLEAAGVAGIAGAAFGPGGKNFVRFSLVSARKLLEEALERMQRVSVHWRAAVSR